MLETHLVSIITPSYNSASFIEKTIESVLEQTYKNWEMIIVDDSSTDQSQELIKQYMLQNKRIKLIINQEKLGAAQSRNRAIEEAKGEYIAFLDSDDLWFSEKLEKQITLMKKNDVYLSYSSYNTIDETGKVMGTFLVREKVTYYDMLKTSTIGTLTTIYNVKELGKCYFEDIGHEDYVMKLQILKKIKFAQGINEPLAHYRIVRKSLSSNKFKAANWQWYIYRKIEKLSLFKSIYYFLYYTYNGIFKYRVK